MKVAVCLHGAGVVHSSLRLHPTDRRAVVLARGLGADVVVVEAVGERGSAPLAVTEGLNAGASRAVRIVEPALAHADSHTTGFALATAVHHLKVDLVLFGCDADPEGLLDVPACIAHDMVALYLAGAVDLVKSTEPATPGVDVSIRNLGWVRRVRIPLNAVVGIAGVNAGPETTKDLSSDNSPSAAHGHSSVEVLALADLNIDPALVRRRDDLRGIVEPAPRPLVTLQSTASVGALLRRA